MLNPISYPIMQLDYMFSTDKSFKCRNRFKNIFNRGPLANFLWHLSTRPSTNEDHEVWLNSGKKKKKKKTEVIDICNPKESKSWVRKQYRLFAESDVTEPPQTRGSCVTWYERCEWRESPLLKGLSLCVCPSSLWVGD